MQFPSWLYFVGGAIVFLAGVVLAALEHPDAALSYGLILAGGGVILGRAIVLGTGRSTRRTPGTGPRRL